MSSIDVQRIAPGQAVEVDFLRPEDAEGVAALFRAVYGESYPHRVYYEPQALREANAAGRIISSVARTDRGDVIGHSALFQTAPFAGLFESGAGLVLPSYRKTTGILTKMLTHNFEMAPRHASVEAIFVDAVLNHPFTQRVAQHLGCIPMGLQIDLMPLDPYAKEGSASGRVASLVTGKTCRPHPHRVHVPAAYAEVLAGVYRTFDDQRELAASASEVPGDSVDRLEAQYFEFAQVARVQVTGVGRDFAARYAKSEDEAVAKGAVVLQAWLDLAIPWSEGAVAWLRGRGYFLGGLVPRWFGGDALFMQKVLHRPHLEGIVMEMEGGQELLEIVRQDWERSRR
jgi:hypothetical protein